MNYSLSILGFLATTLAQPLHAEHTLDFRSGEVSLVFDNKPILKGVFASFSLLLQEFQAIEKEKGLSDELIDSYVWFLRHVKDGDGNIHDVIEGMKNGKIFEQFPLNNWLTQKKEGTFRNLVGMLSLLNDPSLADSRTVELLTHLANHPTGRMQEYAKTSLAVLVSAQGVDHPETKNPLLQLDLQGQSDYLSTKGVQAQKGNVASLMKNVAIYNESPEKRDLALKEIEAAIPPLDRLGFFHVFDEEEFNASPGLQIAYQIWKENRSESQ